MHENVTQLVQISPKPKINQIKNERCFSGLSPHYNWPLLNRITSTMLVLFRLAPACGLCSIKEGEGGGEPLTVTTSLLVSDTRPFSNNCSFFCIHLLPIAIVEANLDSRNENGWNNFQWKWNNCPSQISPIFPLMITGSPCQTCFCLDAKIFRKTSQKTFFI